MKTNETIFKEITENGVITKQQLQLLKIRSNKQQKDVINYDWLQSVGDGYGIPLTVEQGVQELNWLKKFIRKDGSSRVYGYRELNIINNSSPSDFVFEGFYDAGTGWFKYYLPIYKLNGMEYVPMKEPYIIG
jgi:hypothetical protein